NSKIKTKRSVLTVNSIQNDFKKIKELLKAISIAICKVNFKKTLILKRKKTMQFKELVFNRDIANWCVYRCNDVGSAVAKNAELDRKSTRLNSSHVSISYAVFCLKKKKIRNK